MGSFNPWAIDPSKGPYAGVQNYVTNPVTTNSSALTSTGIGSGLMNSLGGLSQVGAMVPGRVGGVLSGIGTGASVGGAIGGPIGAGIGAAIGGIASFFGSSGPSTGNLKKDATKAQEMFQDWMMDIWHRVEKGELDPNTASDPFFFAEPEKDD